MADTKISELPVATAIASHDVAAIVQGGVTKQADVSLWQSIVNFIGLDFTGQTLTFLNGIPFWKSTADGTSRQNSGFLVIGQVYLIDTYSAGDSFTNVGAGSNASGVSFTATGTTPTTWSNGSVLYARPFTPETAGIIVKAANGTEIWRLWADDPTNQVYNLFIGARAGANLVNRGTDNVGIGAIVFDQIDTIGNGNTVIGERAARGSAAIGDSNVLVGDSSQLDENTSGAVVVGSQAAAGMQSTAIGNASDASGVTNAIAIGNLVSVGHDNRAAIGNDDLTDVWFGGYSVGNAILHGKGDGIVFPDADPHIVGAGYWLAGVLTRSSG